MVLVEVSKLIVDVNWPRNITIDLVYFNWTGAFLFRRIVLVLKIIFADIVVLSFTLEN